MSELIISLLGRFQAQLNGQLLTRFESDNARAYARRVWSDRR